MSSSYYLSHSAPLFKEYNLLNVYELYLLEVSTFMYKEFNNKLPDIFHKYLNQQKKACTGIKHVMLKIPCFKTNFARKTIRATAPMKWNSTEKHIKKKRKNKEKKKGKNYKAFSN